ncbi:DUF6919 domain-containing protein [Streptomyces albidoflavus]
MKLPWMSRTDRRAWKSARTIDDLGELMARWLEGTIQSRPGYAARYGPEDETTALVPSLAALCRAGAITTGSQPGLTGPGVNGGWWTQRAWVDLVVTDRALLDRLVAIVTAGGMLVRVHDHHRGAERSTDDPIVATTCDGKPTMAVGSRMRGVDLALEWEGLHRSLVAQVTHGWQVSVVAPQAGSAGNWLLWDLLDEVSGLRDPAEDDWGTFDVPDPGECRLCGAPIYHSGPYCGPACRTADEGDPADDVVPR